MRIRQTLLSVCVTLLLTTAARGQAENYRSPFDVKASPDGQTLAVSDRTASSVYLIDAAQKALVAEIPLAGEGGGIEWTPDGRLLAGEYDGGSVALIDPAKRAVARRYDVSLKPQDVAFAAGKIVVSEYGLGEVQVVDPASGKRIHRVPIAQQPFFLTAIPGSDLVAVGHLIPELPSTHDDSAASVSLVDVNQGKLVKQIRLPYGSTNVRDVVASPDGEWIYVAHTIGKIALPTTQLERGWINTNALTIIDVDQKKRLASVLLDTVTRGAADPWGIALSEDGETAWITLAGAHEIAEVNLAGLHALIAGERKPSDFSSYSGSSGQIWTEIQQGERSLDSLSNHLSALYGEGLLEREEIPISGPRGIARLADGGLAISGYYGGEMLIYYPDDRPATRIALGDQPPKTMARLGEEIFHNADYSFQEWLSCASCHPDARADGLNWDNLNDGIGNPKNTKSMLLTHRTPPMMATGVRADYTVAIEKGMVHFQLHAADPKQLDALAAYFSSLEPEAASETQEPGFAEAFARGEKIFFANDCQDCHSGELFTDLKLHDVGTRSPVDQRDKFDTPTLVEVWRVAPYLHDGRAPTLESLFDDHMHGDVFDLSEDEVRDLSTYLRGL